MMKNIDEVAIFWDYENCPAPTNTSGYAIVNNIRTIAQTFGSVKLFKAYLEVAEQVPMSRAVLLRSELQSSGVSLTDCPHNGRKDVAGKMILVDMLAHAIDNAAPSTIVLISGDPDFAYALSILRFRRYRIVLITHSNAHQSLRAQASTSFDWVSEVLEPVGPTLLNQPPSSSSSPPSRRGKISSPPARDKFYSDSMGQHRHNLSSSLFPESYDEKSANSVEFLNSFQDETRCTEISRTPSKHDSLPLLSERRLASAASSVALNNEPETPTRVVHSPFASCHTYPNGPGSTIQTPLATTACSSESNFSSRTTQTQTCPLQALQNSRLTETSCDLDVLCENPSLVHESSSLSHQHGTTSPIQHLSSVDRMAVGDSHPGSPLALSPPVNFTAKVTAPTPSLIPPSSTLSSATVSATTQLSANPMQPPPFPVVPDIFKVLVQCLKSHRSRGSFSSLRSTIGLEINQNGTTYRMAGVSKFTQYIEMAKKAGIVDLGGTGGTAWVALRAPWYNAPTIP